MRTRKISLILVFLLSLTMFIGCSEYVPNQYSGGYVMEQNSKPTNRVTKEEKDNTAYTIYTATYPTEIVTTAEPLTTTYVEETTNCTIVETEPVVVQTEEVVYEPEVEYQPDAPIQIDTIPNDSIVIHNNAIPLAYGKANQAMVDAYDVVQDTELIPDTNNTILFGHSNGSFSVLDSVGVGETIILNNYGDIKYYEVQRSELAILNQDGTDAQFFTDGIEAIRYEYDYPALVLVTCANGYAWNYRWIVIAKEIV